MCFLDPSRVRDIALEVSGCDSASTRVSSRLSQKWTTSLSVHVTLMHRVSVLFTLYCLKAGKRKDETLDSAQHQWELQSDFRDVTRS